MKAFKHSIDKLSILALLWGAAALLPVESIWYRPSVPVVADTVPSIMPAVAFDRAILRPVRMSYSVIIRSVADHVPICDPTSGPFQYNPESTPGEIDLGWWTGGDERCWPLDPGTYIMETCWTVASPFAGLVPPKTTCRPSPPFHVLPNDVRGTL